MRNYGEEKNVEEKEEKNMGEEGYKNFDGMRPSIKADKSQSSGMATPSKKYEGDLIDP